MARLLDSINSPADVKKIPVDDLPQLAQEIREELISVLAKTGGHLGPNLGVVELTIALHAVFDTPKDSFVFDVSHQAYVHKLLTGRRDRFHTIRQADGLNGFMLRTESEHDSFGAGHAGTALSAALGMATARDMKGGDEHVVALCGDAAFTCGITYEALNNISTHTKRLIVILNDNEWSIDKNVGAIAKYLTDIVTNPRYENLHKSMEKLVQRFGGETGKQLALKAEGDDQGPALHRPSPEPDFRGDGPFLLRPDRRPRFAEPDQDARFREAPQSPAAPARVDEEEQGLRYRRGASRRNITASAPAPTTPRRMWRRAARRRRPTRRCSPRRW